MRDMKIILRSFLLGAIFAYVNSQTTAPNIIITMAPPDKKCGVQYRPYLLNMDPEFFGLAVGEYEAGKLAFVGLGSWKGMALNAGRLQTNPPGVKLIENGGKSVLNTELGSIYYLRPKLAHEYMWVRSQYGDEHPFGVDFGTGSSGCAHYFGRVVKNGRVYMGIVPLYMGRLFYVDENDNFVETATGYDILVCGSTRVENPVAPPQASNEPNVDTGCIHNWVEYNNDNAPETNGVESGEYDINNMGYVGKGNPQPGPWRPGRIEIGTGLHLLHKGAEFLETNNTYYLADNPNYTYKWVQYDGTLPSNSVNVRMPVGHLAFPVTRQKVNGKYKVGFYMGREAYFSTEDEMSAGFYDYYEVLTCDPVPKYKCGAQTWNTYNLDTAPETDGLEAGTFNGVPSYVGRGIQSCLINCNKNIGRIQTSDPAGAYYANDAFSAEVFDNTTAEYLVKDETNNYVWTISSDGAAVANAIQNDDGGSQPSYIGRIVIEGNTFIGKVKPDVGLYYVDATGAVQLSSFYDVLTCFSSNAANGV